jgi:hypothetical protein
LKSVPKKVREKVWEALVQSQVRFKKVPEKVLGGFGAKSGQNHQVPKKNPEKVREALVKSEVRINRVLDKITEMVWEAYGGFSVDSGQIQQGSGKGSREGSGRHWCRAASSSKGSGEGSKKSSGKGQGGFGAESGSIGFPRRFRRRF